MSNDKPISTTKAILSLRVASELLAQNQRIIALERQKKDPTQIAYIFRNNIEIEEYLTQNRRR